MTKTSKTIIFFGNEKLATGIPAVRPVIREVLQSAGFEVEKVVTGKLKELGNHKAKLAVLAAYGRIIPESVLNEFPLGVINVHPSLLPQYRGPTPIEQAILDGAPKTGVSIMHLTAGMDEGPIYKQKTVYLTGKESKLELTELLQRLGAELLTEVLPHIADGSLRPHQQPHPGRATYSHLLTKNMGEIDWAKPAVQLEREVRAFLGWPKSYTMLAGKEVVITAAHVESGSAKIGTIWRDGKRFGVYTTEGILAIDRIKPAGKSEMTAEAFLAGYGNSL